MNKLNSLHPMVLARWLVLRRLLLLGAVTFAGSLMVFAGTSGQKRSDVVERIVALPSIPIDADNSERAPMSVTRARVKTLTGAEYRDLLGVGGTITDHYVSYPETRVSNDTNKTVTEFGFVLSNKRLPDTHWAAVIHQTIAPYGKFSHPSIAWVGVPKAGIEDPNKAAWSSAGMWLTGTAEDYSIYVAEVDYADGSTWVSNHP
jgi:hypothetical protein